MSLGSNISRLRAEKRLSQGELADILNVSRQSVSKWETDASVPDLDKLVRLSRVFDVTLDKLVTGEKFDTSKKANHSRSHPPLLSCTIQTILGIGLLVVWFLMELSLLMGTPSLGLLLRSLRVYGFLLICGLLCLFHPRRTAFWCGWVLYSYYDYFWRDNGLTWKMVLKTIGFDPQQNYLRLAFSWGQFSGMVIMLAWTVFTFRNAIVPAPLRKRGRLLLSWLLYFAISIPVTVRQGTFVYGYSYAFNDIYIDWPLLAIFAALLTITFCAVRSWNRHAPEAP